MARLSEAITRCRACTFAVHQYRHVKKSMDDGFSAAVLEASQTSMKAHISTFADLPSELVVNELVEAVRERIPNK